MASTWGKVLDQASIMLSRQDLEKACIKATRHDNAIPKEKHVRRLIVVTHERADLTDKIHFHLQERLIIPDWIVVLKTLEVYHRLFRDGNPRFMEVLKWKETVFPVTKFNDPTNSESHAQSVFIRKYAGYLEEKVLVYRSLRMEFERDPGLLKGLTVEESFVRLPKIQRQLDALINCQTSAEAITNPITALAFEMLLKDSFKLYRGLNDGIITLLELYFSMEKSLAISALEIYRTFMRETSSIIAMYEMAKKKFTLELPDLKHAPTTLVNSLEDYIRDPDDHGHSATRDQGNRRSMSPPPKKSSTGFTASPQPTQVHNNNSNNTHSLIDPFGVTDFNPRTPQPAQAQYVSPPAQQPNLFDPFGDSTPVSPNQQYLSPVASPPLGMPQPSQSFNQPAQLLAPQQRQPSQSFNQQPTSPHTDPFSMQPSPFAAQPQTQGNVGYNDKVNQIKAAYTPALQPNNTPLQATTSPPGNYPKANYNVNLSGNPQQPAYNNQFGNQYNSPVVVYNPTATYMGNQPGNPIPYNSPQMNYNGAPISPQQQQQQNPFF